MPPATGLEIAAEADLIAPREPIALRINCFSGEVEDFTAAAAVETSLEVEILRVGGIIPFILQRAVKAAATSRAPAQEIPFTGDGEGSRRQVLPNPSHATPGRNS